MKLSRQEATSIGQLIGSAGAEKGAARRTWTVCADAATLADFVAVRRSLDRKGGEPAREDDVLPEDRADLGPGGR